MNINLEAFSSLRYVGIQTQQAPTDYNVIKNALLLELDNTAVRSPRPPEVIFKAIDVIIILTRTFSIICAVLPIFEIELTFILCLCTGFKFEIFW